MNVYYMLALFLRTQVFTHMVPWPISAQDCSLLNCSSRLTVNSMMASLWLHLISPSTTAHVSSAALHLLTAVCYGSSDHFDLPVDPEKPGL